MTRRLLAGGAALCLAAACATTPTRPAAKPATADPFHGCQLQNADATGFSLQCGDVVAMVVGKRTTEPPAARVEDSLKALREAMGLTLSSRKTVRLRLAGTERDITVARLVFKKDHGPFTGMVASFDTEPHHAITLLCGGAPKVVTARCPELMDRMAAHPTTPPHLASGGGWPSKADLARFGDCAVSREDASMVQLTCHGDIVLLRRLAPKATPAERAKGAHLVDVISKASLAMARKKMTAAATLEDVPCHVGLDATVCRRIKAPSTDRSGTIIAGAGRIFHSYALLECIHDGLANGVPPGCARFLRLGPGKATPVAGTSPAPAPKGVPAILGDCAVLSTEQGGYGLRCASVVAVVETSPKTETPAQLQGRLITLAGHAVPGDIRVLGKAGTLKIGGVPRQMTIVASFEKGAKHPSWEGGAFAWQRADHRVVGVVCGGNGKDDVNRCGDITDWMVAHAAPPAGLRRAGSDPSAGSAWLPKKALAGLSGCEAPKWTTGQVQLRCGKVYVTLGRIRHDTGASRAETAHDTLQYAATTARDDFKAHGAGKVKLTWLDCQVGGKASRCVRVTFESTDGLEETLLGAGTLYGGVVLVSCLHRAADATLPAACGRFLQVGGKKPTQ